MTEREKIIKEIASCFCGYYDDGNGKCKLYLHRPLCKKFDKNCPYKRMATNVVDKHIHEGAVVLTKDEYERMKSDRKIKVVQHLDDEFTVEIPQCEYDEMLEQARKETAKEIIKEVKAFLDMQTKTVNELSNSNSRYAIPENCRECYIGSQDNRIAKLKIIAQQYGVEVEE